jgi:ribosomal protein S27E
MASKRAERLRAPPFIDPPGYARHRPEATLLYQLVERYYPEFVATREAAGRPLPQYVQEEFEAYLKCGRLEHGFLRVRCEDCRAEKLVAFSCKRRGFCPSCGARRMTESAAHLADEVLPQKPLRQWVLSLPFALRFLLAADPKALTRVLGIVYRTISAHVLRKARLTRATGATGAVTLIQRFGSALNLNIHFHMLVLDGAYLTGTGEPAFRRIAPPREAELRSLVERLAGRIGRSLERQDLLVRDAENGFLEFGPEAGGAMDDLIGHSITYRVAVGPRAGQKVFALQTVPAREVEPRPGVAQYAGFSLHAGIGVEAAQRTKLERLASYVSRPPVSIERLTLTAQGQVRYRLKTRYRDGTTHIVLEPLDFIARLAALVPPPRKHLTRFHGVFAPHAALRAAVTPAGRGSGAGRRASAGEWPTPRHVAMTWARRLQRVFGIDIERCARCGGRLKVIASIEEPEVIARILAHRRERGAEDPPVASLGPRAPPWSTPGLLF